MRSPVPPKALRGISPELTTLDNFKDLGVPPDLIKGLEELRILTPTEIQKWAIPFLMTDGGDLIAQAQTGTGKTAAFGLPMLTRVDPKAEEVQGLCLLYTSDAADE